MVFDEDFTHSLMYRNDPNMKPVSAGFVRQDQGKWIPYGKSDSLKLAPYCEDELLLTLFMTAGLSGNALQNYLMYLDIQKRKTTPRT